MISLKRYLDSSAGPDAGVLASVLGAYQSALTAMGISAVQACPFAGHDVQRTLTGLGQEVAAAQDPETVASADARVTQELQRWGERAQTSLQQNTNDVKELLVVLARTAATIASSDTTHAKRFDDFTSRLERIANLEDLTQLRTSLVQSAADLKVCVEQMSQNSRDSVAKLQAEVLTYQTRLEEAELLATRDELTGLGNRARVSAHLEHRISVAHPFSVALIDLNGFKQVNDRFGHVVGDDLLKQFGEELRANARPTDMVGRWGGDEFIVVLDGGRSEAEAHVDRIRKWVVGDYTIESPNARQKVRLDAAIGLATWAPGSTIRETIELADAAMYREKGMPR